MTRKPAEIWRWCVARLFRPLDDNAWLVTASLLFLAGLGLATYCLWQQHGEQILSQSAHRLDVDQLIVTPPPSWIRSDIKEFAIVCGNLRGASLHDHSLTHRVAQAFRSNPWVKDVKFVNKRYPSSVKIELEYRRPVAMVVIPPGRYRNQDYEGLLPVDVEGVFLPIEMSTEEAVPFPKITSVATSPAGPPGTAWGDPRVAGAAQIVAEIGELWSKLNLYSVDVPRAPESQVDPLDRTYRLLTRRGHRVVWGQPPGAERRRELSAANKVAVLKKLSRQPRVWDATEPNADAQAVLLDLRYPQPAPTLDVPPAVATPDTTSTPAQEAAWAK